MFEPFVNRFAGKVALVTGAASGIGRAVALRLAAEGADVHALDISTSGLDSTVTRAGGCTGSVTPVVSDVRDRAECFRAVAGVIEDRGRLDVLGNVAGIASADHFTTVSEADYRRMFAVNVDGCFFLAQAAIPHLIENDGNIVNIASTAGLVGQPYTVLYTMTKGAVVQLTRSLAWEYIRTRMRVNAIAPGVVHTELVGDFAAPDDLDRDLIAGLSTPRAPATADDIAALFCFVASDEARNINGAILPTDSGVTAAGVRLRPEGSSGRRATSEEDQGSA